jgi:hypothetical protein
MRNFFCVCKKKMRQASLLLSSTHARDFAKAWMCGWNGYHYVDAHVKKIEAS